MDECIIERIRGGTCSFKRTLNPQKELNLEAIPHTSIFLYIKNEREREIEKEEDG